MHHPEYINSPFLAMVDSHLLTTETIETSLVPEGELDKDAVEDLEEKLDNKPL